MQLDRIKIEELRVRCGLNQTELASKAGISRAWVSTVLLRAEASPEIAVKLADALGVPLSEILKES